MKKEKRLKLLADNLKEAWSNSELQNLGPLQKQLLERFVGQDSLDDESKPLSVGQLKAILEQVKEYFPEDLIPLSKVLEVPVRYK